MSSRALILVALVALAVAVSARTLRVAKNMPKHHKQHEGMTRETIDKYFAYMDGELEPAYNKTKVGSGGSFDFFLFVQSWPKTLCTFHEGTCGPVVPHFTIHGLWPNNADGTYPTTCTSDKFDAGQISDLMPKMKTEWTDLFTSGTSFWAHEYEKHGTCCKDELATQHDFFAKVLDLYSEHDYLSAVGLSAGSSSTLDQINNNLHSAFGTETVVWCLKKSGSQYLHQIGVCMDKEFSPIDCSSAVLNESNCDSSKPVQLP